MTIENRLTKKINHSAYLRSFFILGITERQKIDILIFICLKCHGENSELNVSIFSYAAKCHSRCFNKSCYDSSNWLGR